jgi:hypothetical protein
MKKRAIWLGPALLAFSGAAWAQQNMAGRWEAEVPARGRGGGRGGAGGAINITWTETGTVTGNEMSLEREFDPEGQFANTQMPAVVLTKAEPE